MLVESGALQHVADQWVWGWDAVAAISTSVAVIIALAVPTWDAIERLRERRKTRRMTASGLLHAVQLTTNHLSGVRDVLKRNLPGMRDRPHVCGPVLINPHMAPMTREVTRAVMYSEKAACDFAYAYSLIESINSYGSWLSGFEKEADEEQWERITTHAEFFAEAASQAIESLEGFTLELKAHMPKRLFLRRFGPKPD